MLGNPNTEVIHLARPARPRTKLVVQSTTRLTDHLIRVHLGGPEFATFQPNDFTDAYVKLLFPGEDGATMRTYTVRSVDPRPADRHRLRLPRR